MIDLTGDQIDDRCIHLLRVRATLQKRMREDARRIDDIVAEIVALDAELKKRAAVAVECYDVGAL